MQAWVRTASGQWLDGTLGAQDPGSRDWSCARTAVAAQGPAHRHGCIVCHGQALCFCQETVTTNSPVWCMRALQIDAEGRELTCQPAIFLKAGSTVRLKVTIALTGLPGKPKESMR